MDLKLKDITKFDEIALSTLREEIKRMSNLIAKIERENSILKSKIGELKVKASKPKFDKALAKKYNWIVNSIKKLSEKIETTEIPLELPESITEYEPIAIQEEPKKVPSWVQIPATPQPQIIQAQPIPQTLTIPLEKNLILQKLGGMARKIYETLLQNPSGLTKPQLGLMTGYTYTSGSFSNTISKLSTMGLIKKEGEVYRVV